MDNFTRELFSYYLVFVIFFIIGLLEIIVFLAIRFSARKKLKTWYEATGKVTEVVAGSGSKGGTVYYPVFEFTTYLNEHIRQSSKFGSSPNYYPVGSEVSIFYKPDEPKRFIIKGDKRFKLMFTILGLVFGIFFLIGLAGIVWVAMRNF